MTIVLDCASEGEGALCLRSSRLLNMYGKPAARTPRAGLADGDPAGAGESQVCRSVPRGTDRVVASDPAL